MQKCTPLFFCLLAQILSVTGFSIAIPKIQPRTSALIEKSPVWSPFGDQIAFEAINFNDYIAAQGKSIDNYNYDIWVMNADGSRKINLTTESLQFDANPIWSPDSNSIAFLSKRSGKMDLWVMEATGRNPVNLTAHHLEEILSPSWAPNGRFLSYITENNRGVSYDIWIVEPDGTNPTRITFGENQIYGSVTWSPDSNSIAYINATANPATADTPETFDEFQVNSIWISRIDSKSDTRLTASGRYVYVSWSPRGDYLVSVRAKGLDSGMWLVSVDNSGLVDLTDITPNPEHYPVWSPNGDQIVFLASRNNAFGGWDIWAMNADGSSAINITSDLGIVNSDPSWSPDGMKIAFTSNPPNNTVLGFGVDANIWVMNADGSRKINLTE